MTQKIGLSHDDYEYLMPMRQAHLKWTDKKFDVKPFLKAPVPPFHITAHGAIFSADCMEVLPLLKDEVVDTVFADPPFNLGKEYGKTLTTVCPKNITSGGAKNGLSNVSVC